MIYDNLFNLNFDKYIPYFKNRLSGGDDAFCYLVGTALDTEEDIRIKIKICE